MVNHPRRAAGKAAPHSHDPNPNPIHKFTFEHRRALAGGREFRLSVAHGWQPVIEDQALIAIKMTRYTLDRAAGEYHNPLETTP